MDSIIKSLCNSLYVTFRLNLGFEHLVSMLKIRALSFSGVFFNDHFVVKYIYFEIQLHLK